MLPSHSCSFNSVETLFSLAKTNLERLVQQESEIVDQQDFNRLVREAFKKVSPTAVLGVIKSNRAHIREYLE